jgi:hypothetical protein
VAPLTLDDLLPLEEYAAKRREFFESHRRYLDRYRRVRVGPLVTFLFENRQTLWFRVQEVLRIARLGDPRLIQQELDLFNQLLPGPGQLQAALLIEVRDERHLTEQLQAWAALSDEHLRFGLGKQNCAAKVLTSRPEDRCIGTSHWVQWNLDAEGRKVLADFRQPAWVELSLPGYGYQSPLLNDEIRQSLVDDLQKSQRGAAA